MNKSVNYSGDYLQSNDFFTVELISIIVSNLKTRAQLLDTIILQQSICSTVTLAALILITYICNLILLTGYVPRDFGYGVTYPVPKCSSKTIELMILEVAYNRESRCI